MLLRINSVATFAVSILLLGSCTEPDRARHILERTFKAHGAENLQNAISEFHFRGELYRASRNSGVFAFERVYEDSLGTVRDLLTNDGSFREVNGERTPIDDSTAFSIQEKVNSVVYFSSLPLPLKDPAVLTQYLGTSQIDGQAFHEVEVTFRQLGGGPDHEDRFVYWINSHSDLIEYFAYYYLTNETGSRFRRLVNPRVVGGFLAFDHLNYAARPDTIGSRVEQFDDLLQKGALEIISDVKHENFRVVPLDRTPSR
ncbi:MAG: hypothetical protein HKN13_07210 [Rhodothermales bacterium]|nr:hypothetical protein [Rhodothermales bacterium]